MTLSPKAWFDFDATFAHELEGLYLPWQATKVPAPELVAFNVDLAAELGADPVALQSPEGVAVLVGNHVPSGSTPIAMAYAGHQFGGYSPRLGDGRALLLGEVIDGVGQRRDVHLKGSGRTPYARGGDGRAVIGPMLREFLIAEAMHALGIPTTRALAVLTTGEQVARGRPLPGAVLVRAAASHIRVGTFEYAARAEDPTLLKRLTDYSIRRHFAELVDVENPVLPFLEAVIDRQASLVASWMLVGFVHGVMNTDNMAIAGETIDYGPCAFMDRYDPRTVFSSIDRHGRYAYGNQPNIARWDLTRFAETLLPLIDDDADAAKEAATAALNTFGARFTAEWTRGMRSKLGFAKKFTGEDSLFADFVDLLFAHRVDLTTAFRALSSSLQASTSSGSETEGSETEELRTLFDRSGAFDAWSTRWRASLDVEARDVRDVAVGMDRVNPLYVPRNHLVEEALEAATNGDLAPFDTLLEAVTHPFEERDENCRFTNPAPDSFTEGYRTFCGT